MSKKQQQQLGLIWADKRPREYAEEIGRKVTEMMREELQKVPAEYRRMTVDHVVNGLAITWELKKAKAGRK